MRKFEQLPEIAKLGHVALVSKDLEKSLVFFKDIIGLEETEVVDGVHYLRAWGDFEHHTLSVEAGEESRIDHIAWRTKREEDVESFAFLLEKAGVKVTKVAAGEEAGQGEAIRFQLPSGHPFEIYYNIEKPLAGEKRRAKLKNQVYKSWAKGVSPRRIDHVNIGTNGDPSTIINFLTEKLGFKIREYIKAPNDAVVSAWLSVTPLVHDIAVIGDPSLESPQQLHHLAYWSDNAQDILRAADILCEADIKFVGPGKHGISQALYLYVIDPGSGVRVELFSNSYLILDPDWEPVEWTLDEMDFAFTYWGDQANRPNSDQSTLFAGALEDLVVKESN